MVVEEKAFAGVECGDGCHFSFVEREVEYVDVLLHPFDVGRFGNGNHSALNQPTQSYLCYALAVFVTDFGQYRVGKEVVAAFGEGAPRHDACTELFHDFLRLGLLVEDVCFYLIDCRDDFHIAGDVDEVVGIEVAHADGA